MYGLIQLLISQWPKLTYWTQTINSSNCRVFFLLRGSVPKYGALASLVEYKNDKDKNDYLFTILILIWERENDRNYILIYIETEYDAMVWTYL